MRLWHRCFPVKFKKSLKTLFLQNTSGGCFRNNGIVCMARQHLLEGETKYALNFVLILSQHKLSMCLFNITANVHFPHTHHQSFEQRLLQQTLF